MMKLPCVDDQTDKISGKMYVFIQNAYQEINIPWFVPIRTTRGSEAQMQRSQTNSQPTPGRSGGRSYRITESCAKHRVLTTGGNHNAVTRLMWSYSRGRDSINPELLTSY